MDNRQVTLSNLRSEIFMLLCRAISYGLLYNNIKKTVSQQLNKFVLNLYLLQNNTEDKEVKFYY